MLNLRKEGNFLNAIDTIKAHIYSKDLNGCYVACNQFMADALKVSKRDNIIGKTDFDLCGFDEATLIQHNDSVATVKGTFEGEETLTLANGKKVVYWSIKSRALDAQGETIGVTGISIDITAQKEVEAARRDSEIQLSIANEQEKFRQISDQVIDAVDASIYWKDRAGRYLGCNAYVCKLLGLANRKDIIGKTDYELFSKSDADKIAETDRFVIENGYYRGEEHGHRDGKEIVVLTVKNQLRDDEGNVIGIIGTSLNITAQKEAELFKQEAERERQKNRILELERKAQQFLSEQQTRFQDVVKKIDHDIRSPLTAAISMLNVCDELPEEKRAVFRRSLNSAYRMVHSLGAHYKSGGDAAASPAESRQDLLISDFVTEVFDEKKYQYLKHPIDFGLCITEAGKAAHIDAQAGQLRRALSNILNNAIDALPEDQQGMINIHLDASEKLVEMTICDNGMGMSAETVQKIQNHVAFTANKENGHGLGLQQVWEAIEYNRGKMTIESTVGQGTCFCLTFPRALSAEWLAQEITLVPDTILLILEDETLLHRAWEIRLGSMLRQNRSLQVHYFDQGEALLTHIQALTDNERSRVLLLADYELAYQKQTGLEIIIASKITNAILVTAYSSSPEIRKAVLELGIALLPKQLMDTIPIRIEKDLKKVL